MAEPSSSGGADDDVEARGRQNRTNPSPSTASNGRGQKVLAVSANLAQLLPTGSVMAYQTLAPSFSNQGKCYPSNFWITMGLVVVLSASCVFFAFTDSILHNGKVYYGLAVYGRLNVFNLSKEEEEAEFADILPELRKRGLKKRDFIHATLTVIVFLTMAFSDVGLQNCFFPNAGADRQQLLKNLPLGMAVFSSLVFTIFPTKRKSIGSNDPTPDNVTASSSDDHRLSSYPAAPSTTISHVCACGTPIMVKIGITDA